MMNAMELKNALINFGGVPPHQAQKFTQDFVRMMGQPVNMESFISEYVRMSLFKTVRFIENNMQQFDVNHVQF